MILRSIHVWCEFCDACFSNEDTVTLLPTLP